MNNKLSRTGILLLTAALLVVFTGCGFKNSPATTGTSSQLTSSNTGVTSSAGTAAAPNTSPAATTASTPVLADYFPLTPDVHCRYSGTGNEHVGMTTDVEYVRSDTIQLVYDNSAAESHILYALRDGKVQALHTQFELYAREDLSLLTPDAYEEILIKEPLEVGTSWDILDGTRTITSLNVEVTTPSGTYEALEVTTKGNDNSTARQYYAAGIGFVKLTVSGPDYEVTQELEERTVNTARTENRTFYYPKMTDTNVEIVYTTTPVTLNTNDSFSDILTENFRTAPAGDLHAVFSANSVINSLLLDPDIGIVTIDLSANFVSEMNVGSEMESAILQCLANTVGSAYEVQEVIVTLDGALYESGHIAMKAGETLKVDYNGTTALA